MNSGPAVIAKMRVHRRSLRCRPGYDEAPDLVEPQRARWRRCAATPHSFSCSSSGVPDAGDHGLGLGALPEHLAGLVVRVEDQLEEQVVEEQRDDRAEDEVERDPHDAGAELPEVVAEGHPPALADRVTGPAAEQLDDTADGHCCWVPSSDGAGRLGVFHVGPCRRAAPRARPQRRHGCARRSRAARGSCVLSSSSSSRPLVSALKIRRARPLPRASSGSFVAPNSSTRMPTMISSSGAPRPRTRGTRSPVGHGGHATPSA